MHWGRAIQLVPPVASVFPLVSLPLFQTVSFYRLAKVFLSNGLSVSFRLRTIRFTVVGLPIRPYESVMGLILLSTVPLHLFLTEIVQRIELGFQSFFPNEAKITIGTSQSTSCIWFKALIDRQRGNKTEGGWFHPCRA